MEDGRNVENMWWYTLYPDSDRSVRARVAKRIEDEEARKGDRCLRCRLYDEFRLADGFEGSCCHLCTDGLHTAECQDRRNKFLEKQSAAMKAAVISNKLRKVYDHNKLAQLKHYAKAGKQYVVRNWINWTPERAEYNRWFHRQYGWWAYEVWTVLQDLRVDTGFELFPPVIFKKEIFADEWNDEQQKWEVVKKDSDVHTHREADDFLREVKATESFGVEELVRPTRPGERSRLQNDVLNRLREFAQRTRKPRHTLKRKQTRKSVRKRRVKRPYKK